MGSILEIKERIKSIFEDSGICEENFDISEIDSLQYIQIIVDIEKSLDIKIPDKYLSLDEFGNINNFIDIISELTESKNK